MSHLPNYNLLCPVCLLFPTSLLPFARSPRYYYSLNAAAKKGVNMSSVFNMVHAANMAKVSGVCCVVCVQYVQYVLCWLACVGCTRPR